MLRRIQNPKSKIQNGHRRFGVTLTEVLLAIFVMGIGLLALLVLFPVGMLTMAQAIRDDRMASATANAEAVAEMLRATGGSLRTDIAIEAALREELLPGQAAPTPLAASTNPYFNIETPVVADGIASGTPRFNPLGASPPVLIDPQGTLLWPGGGTSANSGFIGRCVGVNTTPVNGRVQVIYWDPVAQTTRTAFSYGIRRCAPSFTTTIPDVRRTFMQEDEITFDPNGQPRTNGVLIERWRKYSWAYMWRKPRWIEPKMADLTIVMFSGRQVETALSGNPPEPYYLGYAGPATDPLLTAVCDRGFTQGSTEVRLRITPGQTLPAKRGDWLLDATVIPPDPLPGSLPPQLIRTLFNGYFYKIVGVGDVQEIGGVYFQTLEINRPALADGYVGVMITGVADVVEKGDGRMPAN